MKIPENFDVQKILEESVEKQQKFKDESCAKGRHGFTTKTQVSGGMIYTWCTNCGKSWRKPDLPMTI